MWRWEERDDPITEHTRCFPDCEYMRLITDKYSIEEHSEDHCEDHCEDLERSDEHETPRLNTTGASSPSSLLSIETDAMKCKICYESKCIIVFQPCGHMYTCANCAVLSDQCAMCRTSIANRLRVYW